MKCEKCGIEEATAFYNAQQLCNSCFYKMVNKRKYEVEENKRFERKFKR